MNKETRLFIWGLILFLIGILLFATNDVVTTDKNLFYYLEQVVYFMVIVVGVDKINKAV